MRVKVSLLWLFLIIVFFLDVNPVIGVDVGDPAPDFTLDDMNGKPFTLSTCPAKVVLIDFFATYCSPCIDAIPTLRSLYDEYSRDQLEIISISPEGESTLRTFAQQQGMEWIVAQGTDEVFDDYLGFDTSIPHTFLADAKGYIRYDHLGWRSGDESELRSKINSLLSETGNGDSNDDSDTTPEPPPGESDTGHHGPPYTLIAVIGVGVIVFLVIGIVVAGQILGWSEAPKKRQPRKRPRKRRR